MQMILDHGYLKLVTHWGSDESIIEAARMSTNKGFLGWGGACPACCNGYVTYDEMDGVTTQTCGICKGTGKSVGDEKLLRYLWENKHATPFEMAGLTVEIQAPIFVFREWHRHRTQSYNEMSARYTPLPDVNYVPTVERLMMDGGKNKQAQGSKPLTESDAQVFCERLGKMYEQQQKEYEMALAAGVPKELARVLLPVGRYSKMRASANLRNWLGFLTLRMAPNAQWEIRQYAEALGREVAELFPRTWSIFSESKQ